tara:strand:+ start:1167 stop:1304 length:138 start_codon:yes stop_codon:yes gene_type:complete
VVSIVLLPIPWFFLKKRYGKKHKALQQFIFTPWICLRKMLQREAM